MPVTVLPPGQTDGVASTSRDHAAAASQRNDAQRLSAKQFRAVDLLASGATDREVADALKIDRTTAWRWRKADPAFQAALNRRRLEIWESVGDRTRSLSLQALDVLAEAIKEGDRNAALNFLKLAGLGDVNLGRVGPTDPDVIAEAEARERRRQEQEKQEAEVRAAEQASDLALRRIYAAGFPE